MMLCKICHKNETDSTSGICWECCEKMSTHKMKTIRETEKELKKDLISIRNGAMITPVLSRIRTQISHLLEGIVPEEKDYRLFWGSPEFREVPKRFPVEAVWGYNQCRQEIINKINEVKKR